MSVTNTYGQLVARIRAFKFEQIEQGNVMVTAPRFSITRDEYVAAVADIACTRAKAIKRNGRHVDRVICAYEAYKMTGDFTALRREIGDLTLFGVYLDIED
tara:strand:- start:177 stop:479 length:303 start_codon:yes stop_codon:yes gene_type:complete